MVFIDYLCHFFLKKCIYKQFNIACICRSKNDSCGFDVDNDNWRRTFELMMKAKVDNLFDGDIVQTVKLLGRVIVNGTASRTTELHSLEVRSSDCQDSGEGNN